MNELKEFLNWFENNFADENWLDPETDEWRSYMDLPEYVRARESLDRMPKPIKTKLVDEVNMTDPDTKLPVHIAIYKMETGGMVGIDSSFLENTDLPVYSPFDGGIELDVDNEDITQTQGTTTCNNQ